jgi:hypothetical protein
VLAGFDVNAAHDIIAPQQRRGFSVHENLPVGIVLVVQQQHTGRLSLRAQDDVLGCVADVLNVGQKPGTSDWTDSELRRRRKGRSEEDEDRAAGERFSLVGLQQTDWATCLPFGRTKRMNSFCYQKNRAI